MYDWECNRDIEDQESRNGIKERAVANKNQDLETITKTPEQIWT